jgi:hypothetical protein
MQITYAPIELLQSILRRLSIALQLFFKLTDASAPPPLGWRTLLPVLCTTGHHDLLPEDELVDLFAVVPRLDDAEPDDVSFAAWRGRLDFCAVGADFFAGLLAGGPEADRRSES